MSDEFEKLRHQMVDRQIASRGISDERVLEAMRGLARHEFVLHSDLDLAYIDHPLSISYGQTISQPYIVALMTELLRVEPGHKVLEIGTGSGYQAAILARLAERVISIERIPELVERTRELLERLGIENIKVVEGDGTLGWPDDAPYDRVIVTAGAPCVPKALTEQLAEGGRIVIPVGSEGLQELEVVSKVKGKIKTENAGGCRFVKLIGEDGW